MSLKHTYSPEYAPWKNRKPSALQTNIIKQGHDERVFSCPSCKQNMRLVLPILGIQDKIETCTKCRNNFKVCSDESRNIYIYSHDMNQLKMDSTLTHEQCFQVLNLNISATHSEIKRAYKIKMKEYHPDKVAFLGVKLKQLANQESQSINAAFQTLKERGYC